MGSSQDKPQDLPSSSQERPHGQTSSKAIEGLAAASAASASEPPPKDPQVWSWISCPSPLRCRDQKLMSRTSTTSTTACVSITCMRDAAVLSSSYKFQVRLSKSTCNPTHNKHIWRPAQLVTTQGLFYKTSHHVGASSRSPVGPLGGLARRDGLPLAAGNCLLWGQSHFATHWQNPLQFFRDKHCKSSRGCEDHTWAELQAHTLSRREREREREKKKMSTKQPQTKNQSRGLVCTFDPPQPDHNKGSRVPTLLA